MKKKAPKKSGKPVKSAKKPAGKKKNGKKRAGNSPWRLVLEIVLGLAVLGLGALLLFGPDLRPTPAAPEPTPALTAAPTPEPSPAPALLTVRLHGPEQTEELQLSPGETLIPPEAPLEGYTFLRWQDADGQALPAAGAPVWTDGDYYPVYAMRLGRSDHQPYLPLDENGAFHPNWTMSRREVIDIIYDQLDTSLVGDGRFLDVPDSDPVYYAAATLKQLGALSGSRLHPDETITRQELLGVLCHFFPEGTGDAVFSDLTETDPVYPLFRTAAQRGWLKSGTEVAARPDAELTRIEFVCIMNRILNRCGDRDNRWEMIGTIVDVSRNDSRFWEVAEASVPHVSRGEGEDEVWLSCETLPLREEGLFFLGTDLHAIDAQGNPVVNGEYAGLRFDADGIETSGNAELDKQIRALLPGLVDPEKMEPEKMLYYLFDYIVRDYRYRPGHYYPFQEPHGWEAQEALDFLAEKFGNCYSYAALYAELCRAVGFDARAITGAVIGGRSAISVAFKDVHGNYMELPPRHIPHGWTEIDIDGETYIFDTEYAFRVYHTTFWDKSFFKMGQELRERYGYVISADDLPSEEEAKKLIH